MKYTTLVLIILILFNIKNNVVFFLTPSEFFTQEIKSYKKIRIGGMVKDQSILINPDWTPLAQTLRMNLDSISTKNTQ